MTVASDLITDALQKIGVYAAGEPLSAADSALGLRLLNRMLDSWSNESLTCYAILEQSHALTVNQYQYTIGTGGNFNMTRPIRIIGSPGSVYLLDTNGNRYNLEVVPRDKWNLIGNITQVTSNIPNTLFYDPQFPLGVINVYPIPNIAWTLYWDSYQQFTDFAAIGTTVSLPPGYEKAIVDNLAVEYWPYWKADQAQVNPTILRDATISKGNVKRVNIRDNIARYDPEIVARGISTYNIYTDGGRGSI